MLRKFIDSLSQKTRTREPQQGKRLLQEETPSGETLFTVKGQGRPGFFIVFGLIFGGPTFLVLLAMIFGEPSPDNEETSIFFVLFILPFIAVGAGTLATGLYLWFGKTKIRISQNTVSVGRELFGKVFQQKEFTRANLNLNFAKSHESNDVPFYKLSFNDDTPKNKIGVGGSLKEEELLWLERETRAVLGLEHQAHRSVAEAISQDSTDEIYDAVIDPNYQSKSLRITRTNKGWEALAKSSFLSKIFIILFGSIFFAAGLAMAKSTRLFLFDLLPWLGKLFENAESSGGEPPFFFPLIFGGVGFFIMLLGLFQIGYRVVIAKRHSRLHVERKWLVFTMNSVHDQNDLTGIELKNIGNSNGEPRYRLRALVKNSKKVTLLLFATSEDAGQLHSRISEMLPEPRD